MSLARRLLTASGGTGSFADPAPGYVTLVPVADAGAILQSNYPNAVYYNGVTYFGYNNGDDGGIEVRTYTHATGVTSGRTVIHASLEKDGHTTPALLMRASDHRLMVFYMKHSGSVAYMKVATTAESIAAFGAEVSLHTSIGAPDYTYPSPHQLTGLPNQPIYLFFRAGNSAGTPGTQAWISYTVSSDGGATWSAVTYVHKPSTARPYWMVRSNGVDRIDVFTSETDRAYNDNVPGAHFYFDGTTWRGTAGSALAGSLPFAYSAFTEVYDGTAGSVDPMDIVYQADGKPIVGWRLWKPVAPNGGRDNYVARWTGGSWASVLMQADADQLAFKPGSTAPILTAYTRRLVSGNYQIWRYRSSDYGATWASRVVWAGTPGDLASIRDQGAGLEVLWDEVGTYVDAFTYDFGMMGATG